MDSARPTNANNLLTLKQASERLGVTPDILLNLNEYNILKPSITLSGEIGYSQEQIINFLAIQQLSAQRVMPGVPSERNQQQIEIAPLKPAVHNISVQTNIQANTHSLNLTDADANVMNATRNTVPDTNKKIRSFLKISSLSFLFFLSLFAFFIRADDVRVSKESELHGSIISPSPAQHQNRIVAFDNPSNEKINDLNENIAPLNQVFEGGSTNDNANKEIANNTEIPLPDAAQESNSKSAKSDLVDFASKPSCPSCMPEDKEVKSVFDDNGNIKGEQPKQTNLLAATSIGTTRIDQVDNQAGPKTNPIVFLGISLIGLLSMMFIFRNQIALAMNKSGSANPLPNSYIASSKPQKILEVSQKTDGTVVLHILGKEHKISKPELDSESDQFITRLMELAQDNIKEIDYDTLTDETIRFNAPLSKLVTRLGFVGIKRDLFFPRTSKNKVLLRKYVTEQDLIAMSLTTEQILNYL
ncbi:MAG TPA: hypothetical protein VM077_01285 [Candidatus Limnocylindrales bacterium]|nr:hypothetical protein [Candidatus Limnocylindrales bacterium]